MRFAFPRASSRENPPRRGRSLGPTRFVVEALVIVGERWNRAAWRQPQPAIAPIGKHRYIGRTSTLSPSITASKAHES